MTDKQITDQLLEVAEYKNYGVDEKLCFWEVKVRLAHAQAVQTE